MYPAMIDGATKIPDPMTLPTMSIVASNSERPRTRAGRPSSAIVATLKGMGSSGSGEHSSEILQDLLGMRGGIDLRIRLPDLAVLADQVGDPLRGGGAGVVRGSVGDADLSVHVAEERKVELELLGELRV